MVTPALLMGYARPFYLVLAVVTVIGLGVAWVFFSGRTGTEFDREAELASPPEPAHPAVAQREMTA